MGKKLFLCLQQREGSSGTMPVWLKDPCRQQTVGPSRSRRVKNSAVPRVKGFEWRVCAIWVVPRAFSVPFRAVEVCFFVLCRFS
ncbi:MAG: hypothetical protein E7L17_14250 [Clostridium sp.]|uniref:hypothetical protein n=1 Tax=Clostridium sp. TaxID=1506 RepID=UPI0029089670|nr:hypothetical protein [Clostridium sp.]MDU7339260.1 hypothetical protein [Clostridium sp.]